MKSFIRRKGLLLACAALLAGWSGIDLETRAAGQKEEHLRFTLTATVATDVFADANATTRAKDKHLEVRPGETILVTIHGTPVEGWHTYPIRKRAPKQETQASEIRVQPDKDFAGLWTEKFQGLWPVVESMPKLEPDVSGVKVYQYDEPFTWTVEVLVRPTAAPAKDANLALDIDTEICSNSCLFEHYTLNLPVSIMAGGTPISASVASLLKKYDDKLAELANQARSRSKNK